MKVVFLDDVPGVALGGEVKDVKNGFARNYLIPQRLAVAVSADALRRVGKLGQKAEVKRLKTLQDMKLLGKEIDGKRVDVEMRSGVSGRLYGSVTNSIVAEKISEMTGREIGRRAVDVPEPIRELGKFSLNVRLHPDVVAIVDLLVYPSGSDPEEFVARLDEQVAVEELEEGVDVANSQEEPSSGMEKGEVLDPNAVGESITSDQTLEAEQNK